MSNSAVLNGHVISDMLRNGISTVVMLFAGFFVGFRPEAGFVDWLLIAGILLLFTFAFSWLAAIVGVLAKSVEAVQWLTFIFVFPLTFASSAFVPAGSLSGWIGAFAKYQPITQVVEAVRALLIGAPLENFGWLALVWSVGITVVSMPVAIYLFKQKTTQ